MGERSKRSKRKSKEREAPDSPQPPRKRSRHRHLSWAWLWDVLDGAKRQREGAGLALLDVDLKTELRQLPEVSSKVDELAMSWWPIWNKVRDGYLSKQSPPLTWDAGVVKLKRA